MSDLQLLSNGSYHVLVTASGHGYNRWGDTALTRWNADATLDDRGYRFPVRDHSAGYHGSLAACSAHPRAAVSGHV